MSPVQGYPVHNKSQTTQLQSTVSAATSDVDRENQTIPHHPITCTGSLAYNDDGSLACDHAKTEAGDRRTQACAVHSIALMLIELAMEL